ncbi:hypothetical protein ABZ499_27265 [Streptomyces sp. NPDC019990]|uniref:hypothetical protein n=1 Tax=Streptomyces sp. NPDC019990 TaxID=3154693 RepID=UPI0033EC45C6
MSTIFFPRHRIRQERLDAVQVTEDLLVGLERRHQHEVIREHEEQRESDVRRLQADPRGDGLGGGPGV